ncbi:MAG: hypothetical protein FJZ00_14915, partial [Candidatus Sericytochromatia bacterium]|nr:hypothetical protein [Candidatus Tanganyikabacteria bacterium]
SPEKLELTLEQVAGTRIDPAFSDKVAVADTGRLIDQPIAGPGSGLKASFNYPGHIAWRRVGDKQELYILDLYSNAVRRATAAYDGDFKDGIVETIAGKVRDYTRDTGRYKYTVTVGESGPAAEGAARAVAFGFGKYDPADPDQASSGESALAVDAALDRVFIGDAFNRALRMLDLKTGQVRTLVAHDPSRLEGDSRRVQVSALMGPMALLPDHSLLWVDLDKSIVRRLHLEFGL